MRKLSIVTPCFNEEMNVDECYVRVRALFEGPLAHYAYEHIFCDNASADDTVGKLRAIAARDERVKLIMNSRNFGAFANIFNGLTAATGDAVIAMLAADLQDPPDVMVEFAKKWEEGYEVVYGIREQREEGWLLRSSRRIFYRIVNAFSPFFIPENVGEYQLIDRVVADHVVKMDDHFPFVRGMIAYCGFRATGVPYTWKRRRHGVSSSTVARLVEQGLNGIVSFSNVPMRLVLLSGFVIAAVSIIAALLLLVFSALHYREFAPPGIPLLIMMVAFFSGIFLFVLGFIGEYIVAIHSQVRKRPLVIERGRVNFSPLAPEHAPLSEVSAPDQKPAALSLSSSLIAMKRQRIGGTLSRDAFWREASGRAAVVRQLQPMIEGGTVREIEVAADSLRIRMADGTRFIWDPEDVRTAPNIAVFDGEYEPQEFAVLSALAKGKTAILDVGANIGWYAIRLSRTAANDATLFCFEPVPTTYEMLVQNIRLNGVENSVRTFNFGLGHEAGSADFFLPEVSGSVAASARNLHPDEKVRKLTVRIDTADDFVRREAIKRIDLIKCDVEGAELDVLRGARQIIENDKPVLFLEMLRKWSRQFGYHPNDIIAMLGQGGYRCWGIGERQMREIETVSETTTETNYVFLHSTHAQEMAALAGQGLLLQATG